MKKPKKGSQKRPKRLLQKKMHGCVRKLIRRRKAMR